MKLQMKREALDKINRMANQMTRHSPRITLTAGGFGRVRTKNGKEWISVRAEML
jgi:hypothetical protein